MIPETKKSAKDEDSSKYAQLWLQEDVKEMLEKRLQGKKIYGGRILDEYTTAWREGMISKDPVKLIMNHPGLLKEDYKRMDDKMEEQKKDKVLWAFGSTGATFLMYNLGFKNHWFFYNFFKRKHKYRMVSFLKRSFCTYMVFVGNLAFMNYIFNTRFKLWIEDSGLIQKYNLQHIIPPREE